MGDAEARTSSPGMFLLRCRRSWHPKAVGDPVSEAGVTMQLSDEARAPSGSASKLVGLGEGHHPSGL